MEFKSILIKDTTVEERKQIVKESLGNISASCDGCMARLSEMYDEYIEGKKEIRDINMEFNGHYLRGDMDKGEKRSCPMWINLPLYVHSKPINRMEVFVWNSKRELHFS